MRFDPIAGSRRDRSDDAVDPGVVDLLGPAAAQADDVMVVDRLARNIGVLPGRQVEPLDDPELGEQVERPEDGGPTDAKLAGLGVRDEVGGREVARALGDELGHRPPGRSHPVTGVVERGQELARVGHAGMILSLRCSVETQSQSHRGALGRGYSAAASKGRCGSCATLRMRPTTTKESDPVREQVRA